VGEHPFAVEISPDGRWALALNVQSNDVSVVDLRASGGPRVAATLKVGLAPYGVDFSADSRRAFVTNQHERSVSVIDLERLQVAATWAGPEYPEGIAVAGDRVLVVSWMDDLLQVLDAASGQRLGEVATGGNPRAFGRFVQP
jgi:YVTN family beta-propeller protein